MSTIASEVKVDEAALGELERSFRGELVRPDGPDLRRAPQDLERVDRSLSRL